MPGPDLRLAVVNAMLSARHATVALCDDPGDGTSPHTVFPGVPATAAH